MQIPVCFNRSCTCECVVDCCPCKYWRQIVASSTSPASLTNWYEVPSTILCHHMLSLQRCMVVQWGRMLTDSFSTSSLVVFQFPHCIPAFAYAHQLIISWPSWIQSVPYSSYTFCNKTTHFCLFHQNICNSLAYYLNYINQCT